MSEDKILIRVEGKNSVNFLYIYVWVIEDKKKFIESLTKWQNMRKEKNKETPSAFLWSFTIRCVITIIYREIQKKKKKENVESDNRTKSNTMQPHSITIDNIFRLPKWTQSSTTE